MAQLVSFNIQYGFGADGRYDLARAAGVVAGADIIALQEVERFWDRSNDDDQPALLSVLLPEHHWVYGPAFDMDGRDDQLNALWTEITRTAAPGARVIFRTAAAESLLPGRVSPALLAAWDYREDESRDLAARDRSAIYGGFHLYVRR